MVIKIATIYSKTPGGRYASDGKFSAEEFRNKILAPAYSLCMADNEKLCVDLDGGYGYTPGFLEESFGGLVRLGFYAKDILDNISFVSMDEPKLIEDIKGYIRDEGIRHGMEMDKGGIVL